MPVLFILLGYGDNAFIFATSLPTSAESATKIVVAPPAQPIRQADRADLQQIYAPRFLILR
jgi:acetyltransferase-like isoleucine patch superfamily enzyme